MDVEWLTLETAQVLFLVSLGGLFLIFAIAAAVEAASKGRHKAEPGENSAKAEPAKPEPAKPEPEVTGLYAYRTDDPFDQTFVRVVESRRNEKGKLYVQYVFVRPDGRDYTVRFSKPWSDFERMYRPIQNQ